MDYADQFEEQGYVVLPEAFFSINRDTIKKELIECGATQALQWQDKPLASQSLYSSSTPYFWAVAQHLFSKVKPELEEVCRMPLSLRAVFHRLYREQGTIRKHRDVDGDQFYQFHLSFCVQSPEKGGDFLYYPEDKQEVRIPSVQGESVLGRGDLEHNVEDISAGIREALIFLFYDASLLD